MSSGENIRNALQVLYKTYDNVQKLIDFTRMVAQEKTDYRLAAPKVLRWRSENETNGWLLSDFILLFQNIMDLDCESENGWKDAPIYAMEICLGDKDWDELPYIHLSKFEYDDINSWDEGCSPGDYWAFYWPLYDQQKMSFFDQGDYFIGVPKNEKYSDSYWGLKKVTYCEIDLMAVNSDNLKELIFNRFDLLRQLD